MYGVYQIITQVEDAPTIVKHLHYMYLEAICLATESQVMKMSCVVNVFVFFLWSVY